MPVLLATPTLHANRLAQLVLGSLLALVLVACGESGGDSSDPASLHITSISITAASQSLAQGGFTQLSAIARLSDGSSTDVSSQATWASSATAIAAVNSTGLIASASPGSVTISATQSGISGQIAITVTPAILQSITVTSTSPSIAKGLTTTLVAWGNYSDGTTQDISSAVEWLSTTPAIADVTPTGTLTALSAGTASVTATGFGVSGHVEIDVTPVVLQSAYIQFNTSSLAKGLSTQLHLLGNYSDGTTQGIASASWSSSNPSIATIDASGLVSAVAQGQTTVTASFNGISSTQTITITSAVLQSITVTADATSIPSGGAVKLAATGLYSDGTSVTLGAGTSGVQWSSLTAAIASVNSTGTATALSPGAATIKASFNGISGTASFTVTAAVLQSISVQAASLPKGLTQQMVATGHYSDGTSRAVDSGVIWQSSNTAVATISSSGVATGVSTGTATITAVVGGISDSISLTVTSAVLQSISITPDTYTVPKGTYASIVVMGKYSDGQSVYLLKDARAVWTSSNSSVATYSTYCGIGVCDSIKGVSPGTAVLSVTIGSASASFTVTVTAAVISSITISPSDNQSILRGLTKQLTAKAVYTDGSSQTLSSGVAWSSSSSAVATVSSSGLVTAISPGNAQIRASYNSFLTSIGVTVTTPTLQSISISSLSAVPLGGSIQANATGHYSDGSTQSLTAVATWTSTNNSVAYVVAGLVTGQSLGSATIATSYNGFSASTSATVVRPATPPTLSMSLSPVGFSYSLTTPYGIEWSSQNATSCTASGSWSGAKSTQGSYFPSAITTAGTYNYTLTCSGLGGSVSKTSTLVLNGVPVPSISASYSSGMITITWSATNSPVYCVISGFGSGSPINGSGSISFSATSGTYSFPISCTNTLGTGPTVTSWISVP